MNQMANNTQKADEPSSIPPDLASPQHVHFSEDAMAGQESQPPAAARSRPRGLTIDTQASEENNENRPDIEITRDVPDQPAISPIPRRSPVSPISPRRRGRGLSLRSQLFFRSAQSQHEARASGAENPTAYAPADDMAIELAAVENSNNLTMTSSKGGIHFSEGGKDKKLTGAAMESLPNYTLWNKKRSQSLGTRANELYQKLLKIVLRINDILPSKDGRHIPLVHVGQKEQLIDERTGRCYVNNTIRSSRYTLWNFLPRQLFAQFSKLANL